MGSLYNNWVITKKYAEIETAALTSGDKIEYVRIITSDDTFVQSDLKSFTDLILSTVKVRQSASVSSVTVKDNVVTVTAIITSTGNTQDYDANTALLVCKYKGTEFLAAATTANTPQRIPAEGDEEKTEFTLRPQFVLSNSETVSTQVDPVTAATNERVDTEVEDLQSQIDKAGQDRKGIWSKIASLVDLAGNQTISGVKTFTKTIVGSISGNAGTATKLQSSRTISLTGDVTGSKEFDGSANAAIPASLAPVTQADTTNTQTAAYGGTVTMIDRVARDGKGRVTGANTKTVTLPAAYVPPVISQTDTKSNEAPNNGSTFTVIDSVTRNAQGNVTGTNLKTVTMPTQVNVTGNAGTATKLQAARVINNVPFDGTKNITLTANPTVNSIPNNADLNDYKTAGLYHGVAPSGLKNKPSNVAGTWFTLLVQQINNTNACQIYFDTNTTQLFIRKLRDTTDWGNWESIFTDKKLTVGLSESEVKFDSSTLQTTIPVKGILPVSKGGTGRADGLSLGLAAQSLADNTDLNTILKSGIYYLGGKTFTNAPANYERWGILIVQRSGDEALSPTSQILIANRIMFRYYAGAPIVWSNWRGVFDDKMLIPIENGGTGNIKGKAQAINIQTTSVMSFNNDKLEGWFYVSENQKIENAPYSSGGYFIESAFCGSFQADSGLLMLQRAYSLDASQPALYRTFNRNAWTDWRGYI